ncbi:serine hydrolase [Kiritimatiellota bacterium B12222]|nr:serine hydrolase [Kiritimatiellota bacterium B12222]
MKTVLATLVMTITAFPLFSAEPEVTHAQASLESEEVMASHPGRSLDESVMAGLPLISDYAEEVMKTTAIPGLAMVVIYQDELVLMKTWGTRRAGEDLPITEDSIFQFASLSKPMSSSVVAAAVDQDLLHFSDPVAAHGVDLTLHDQWMTAHVTVADLLSHRSGLADHAGDYLEDMGFSADVIRERVGQLAPAYPFRNGYAYTNAGFSAGATAAAKAADAPFDEIAQKFMFEPLGMANSSFRFADFRDAKQRAYTHVKTDDGSWQPLFVRDPDEQAPAGGLSTSISDYSRWMRMQLNEGMFEGKQIVSSASLSETWRPHSQTSYNSETHMAKYYALGWNVSHDPTLGLNLSHSGAFMLGARSAVFLWPDEDLGIAIVTNSGLNGVPEAIGLAFKDLVTSGSIQRDWIGLLNEQFEIMEADFVKYQFDVSTPPASPEPAASFENYVGSYANDYFGPLVVSENAGVVSFTIGPKPFTFSLTHWDGDTFLFQPIGENAGGPGSVIFHRSGKGPAESVTLSFLDQDGMGTFMRNRGAVREE